jgi:hypothetical protein
MTDTHTAQTTMQWLAGNWGWIVLWCIILGVPGTAAEWWRRTLAERHERKLELIAARQQAATLRPAAGGGPAVLGSCPHKTVVPVRDGEGTLVAWLCANPVCDAEFPPESAVLRDADGGGPR